MKAVILAAGEGIRMRPLTTHTPKPMLPVGGKPLIVHMIDALPPQVTEIAIVTGYLAEAIERGIGSSYRECPITYIRQERKLGTADALWLCREFLADSDRFILAYADDLHDPIAIRQLLEFDRALLVHEVADPSRFGIVTVNEEGVITSIIEKPVSSQSRLAAVGVYLLDQKIFDHYPREPKGGEFFLTDSISELALREPFHAVGSQFWVPIGYPSDLDLAEHALRRRGDAVALKLPAAA